MKEKRPKTINSIVRWVEHEQETKSPNITLFNFYELKCEVVTGVTISRQRVNPVIKSNTKVLFIEVAPSGKSELVRAGTYATERSQNRGTRASNPNWEKWYQLADRARRSKKLHHRGVVKSRRKQEQSRLVKLRPAASWWARQESQEQSKCGTQLWGGSARYIRLTTMPHINLNYGPNAWQENSLICYFTFVRWSIVENPVAGPKKKLWLTYLISLLVKHVLLIKSGKDVKLAMKWVSLASETYLEWWLFSRPEWGCQATLLGSNSGELLLPIPDGVLCKQCILETSSTTCHRDLSCKRWNVWAHADALLHCCSQLNLIQGASNEAWQAVTLHIHSVTQSSLLQS